jgi:hypothetical protein
MSIDRDPRRASFDAPRTTRSAAHQGRATPQKLWPKANAQLAAGRIDKASDRLANVLPVEVSEMTTALEEVCAIGE